VPTLPRPRHRRYASTLPFLPSSAPAALIEKRQNCRKRVGFIGGDATAAARQTPQAPRLTLGMGLCDRLSLMVKSSILVAFIGASLAWLVVSVAAWCVRRKMRSVRKARTAEKNGGSAVSRSRYG
jgi:hypothetical protein